MDSRFGVYLIPPPEVVEQAVRIRDLLRSQFGFKAASKFPVHITLKGFFKPNASLDALRESLNSILLTQQAFDIFISDINSFDKSVIKFDVMWSSAARADTQTKNVKLVALHTVVCDAVLPFVASDCDFTPHEGLREAYSAHITLAFKDIPPHLFDEAIQFCRYFLPFVPSHFRANKIQLFQFYSNNWAGFWWETLTWQILQTWTLQDKCYRNS